jgi:O-antigen/teichoic acid export membrane protein
MSVPVDSVQLARLFRRGFAATFLFDLLSSLLGAATVVILIRGLSVSAYAYTTLFLTFAQFAGAAAAGGVRTRYLREEAERVSRATAEAQQGAFSASLIKGTLLIVALGICAAPAVWASGFGSRLGGGLSLVLYGTAAGVGFSAVEFATAHYQARRRFFTAGALRVLRATALLCASLAIVLLDESVWMISLSFVGSLVVVGLLCVAPIARKNLKGVGASLRSTRLNHEEIWLSLYYFASGGFAYVDVMVAGAILDKYEVATLGASLRYLAIVLAAVPALGAVLRVRTAQADLVDSPTSQQTMLLRWLRTATLPAGILVAGAMVLAPFLIPEIDGGRYPDSIVALQIFLAAALSAYLFAPAASMLMAQRRYVVLAAIYGLGLTANLLGDLAVARRFGVLGIATVSTAVYVTIEIAMVILALGYARADRDGSD